MSDIIYTPPSSSGGGQNPTTNYIPLNNGTSNFVDSNIYNVKGGVPDYLSLYIDNVNNYITLGSGRFDFTGFNYFYDTTNNIEINSYGNSANSVSLDFELNWNTFTNSYAFLKANSTGLYIDDTKLDTRKGGFGGNVVGLKLDFANNNYSFGDFVALNNGTHLYIDDANQITTFTTEYLEFKGANLISGSSGGPITKFLPITINGTSYKISLDAP